MCREKLKHTTIMHINLQQIVLAVVPAAVPSCPPQNPSWPATKVVPPVLDGAKNKNERKLLHTCYIFISLICVYETLSTHLEL